MMHNQAHIRLEDFDFQRNVCTNVQAIYFKIMFMFMIEHNGSVPTLTLEFTNVT